MALSSVILVAGKRTTSFSRHSSQSALEKRGRSGTQSAFRFLDSKIKGKRKASDGAKKKKKGFTLDVVEDDQMGDLIVVKEEDNQEEEEGL